MDKFLGYVKKRGTYYNFEPIYKILESGNILTLDENDYKSILPDSNLPNINFSYLYPHKDFMEEHFDEDQAVVFEFSLDDLELNYRNNGEINPTRYKVQIFELYNEGRLSLPEDNGIYRIIGNEYFDNNYTPDTSYIDINDDIGLYEGMQVYLENRDRSFSGPYEIKYRKLSDSFFVLTKTKEKNYISESYRFNSVKILKPIYEEPIEYLKLNKDAKKQYKDIISDKKLLEGLRDFAEKSFFNNGMLDLSNVDQLYERLKQSPFLINLPNDTIRQNRINRIKEILTVTEKTEEQIGDILGILSPVLIDKIIEYSGDKPINLTRKKEDRRKTLSTSKQVTGDLKESQELIQYICKTIKTVRPEYDNNFIINLMISIFQNRLTVFSGKPGCGKTSICNIIGQTLGLNRLENRYIPVSVERGWTSKNDFVGYYNPLTEKFDEKNKGVYSALNLADSEERNHNHKYPILFLLDEANLSPIEYYWADFMNACDDLDMPGEINIGGGKAILVPETVHFVATINNDHTTETLSPRLIDRASIITLPEIKTAKLSRSRINNEVINSVNWSSVKDAFINTANEDSELPAIYKKATDLFEEADINISTRTNIAVRKYYSTAYKLFVDDELERDKESIIIDYSIAQRLLPKINGFGDRFYEWINELCDLLSDAGLTHSLKIAEDIRSRGTIGMNYYQFFA